MKHVTPVSRLRPAKAFYYNLSLTQKIMELATISSFADSALGMLKGLFAAEE